MDEKKILFQNILICMLFCDLAYCYEHKLLFSLQLPIGNWLILSSTSLTFLKLPKSLKEFTDVSQRVI